MKKTKLVLFTSAIVAILFSGCSSIQNKLDSLSGEAEKRNAEIAIVSFQKTKGLAVGGIKQQTLKKLGM